ncbi:hypothetical protein ACIGD1_33360 [Streptomyces sp. NPDC085612]|uniref:hypothetical protein n=1 Tax=Streptomyces sp. NPDC085612 TaxID=3365732 RepID=UPI0037D48A3A
MAFAVHVAAQSMERAARVGKRLRLLDVRMFEISGKIIDIRAADELQNVEEFSSRVGIELNEQVAAFNFHVDLTIKGVGGQPAVDVSLRAAALFEVLGGGPGGDVEVSEQGDFAAFGATTVQMIVFPYVRSAISELTMRLGCPPVTLDLLVLQEASGDSADVEPS